MTDLPDRGSVRPEGVRFSSDRVYPKSNRSVGRSRSDEAARGRGEGDAIHG